jgi:paraquat-inducible protein B
VLYIGIDIDPKAPPPVFHQLEKIYPEIPTKPTQIQQLMQNLASLDVKSLQTNLNNLITKLDSTVGRLDMAQISHDVTNLLASVNRLVSSPDITNGLAAIKPTLDQYRELGAKLTGKIDPLADSITNSLAEANRALTQLRGAGENLRMMLAPDAPIRNDLDLALQQMAAAGQSISDLVDFLKRNPNALIVGRQILPAKP